MQTKSQQLSEPVEQFVVEYGRDRASRSTKRYFDTFPQAEAFASEYFRIRGVVLGIEKVKRETKKKVHRSRR